MGKLDKTTLFSFFYKKEGYGKMDKKMAGAAAGAAFVYLIVYFIIPRVAAGSAFYFSIIISWTALLAALFCACKRSGMNLLKMHFSKDIVLLGISVAIFQIVALFGAGVVMGFGRSPYSMTPYGITVNVLMFISLVVALEFARATVIGACSKRGMLWKIAAVALFFTLLYLPPTSFINLAAGIDALKFFGSAFIPTLAINLFATFLVALGGASSSISYLLVIEAFQWLSPIIPTPTWTVKALIETVVPSIGFLIVSQFESGYRLMRMGIIKRSDLRGGHLKRKGAFKSWIVFSIALLTILWIPTGLFGFQPTVVAGDSMVPTMRMGDIAITVSTSPDNIKSGDVIVYMRQGSQQLIIHRVVEVSKVGNGYTIITKGDANNAADPPIIVSGAVSKVINIIPQIGWASIYLKSWASQAGAVLSANALIIYGALLLMLGMPIVGYAYYRATRRKFSI